MVSHMEDVHTMLNIPLPNKNETTLLFPADLMLVGEKTYLKQIFVENSCGCAGGELISINDLPMEEIKKRMFGLLPGETASFKRNVLESDTFKALLREMNRDKKEFRLVFKNHEGQKTCVLPAQTYKMIKAQRKPRKPKQKQEPFSLTFKGECAVLKIGDFTKKKYSSFLSRSFALIKKKGVSRLLIDMRGNPGGDSENMEKLLSYLISKPVKVLPLVKCRASKEFKKAMKKGIPSLIRWLPVQKLDKRGKKIWSVPTGSLVSIEDNELVTPKPLKKRYSGRLFVLVNGNSLSCGSLFPYYVKKWGVGRIVGTETGSREDGAYGHPIILKLPHSKLPFMVSGMVLRDKPDSPLAQTGLMPDIEILRDFNLEIKGVDSQLEKALELLKGE